MNDRAFYIAAAVAAVLIIALSTVWPQGEGSRSPGPFGHAVILPDYYRMVRERDARKAQEAQQRAAQEKRDAALHAAASSASSSLSARAAK
jgi:hypothetical protein